MTFQLDTTGVVDADKGQHIALDGQLYIGIGWGILTPFTQGYIEALMTSAAAPLTMWPLRFDMLAPETLARIIADCEAWCAEYSGTDYDAIVDNADAGLVAWRHRQNGRQYRSTFPPLTVQLGDDGKVRFA